MGIGDWGLGIGDWGVGIGRNPQSPIPMRILTSKIVFIINKFYKLYAKFKIKFNNS